MKAFAFLFLFLIQLTSQLARQSLAAEAAKPKPDPKPELIIYTYDSFVAKGGPGPVIFPIFESRCGCRVKALASGDGGQLLARLQLDAERKKPTAHVVIGLDQHLWQRAKAWVEPWGDWRPKGYTGLVEAVKVIPPEEGFLPFDHGIYSFIADLQVLKKKGMSPPRKLSDLLDVKWRRNIILEDPRASTPGMAFLLFTQAALGKGVWSYWKSFQSQWLTLASGWDSAYALFLKGEAPLVWSYTTSQAYHREHGDTQGRYRAIVLQEGAPVQIEGAALVKGTLAQAPEADAARKRARDFLEFLISPEIQQKIATTNWMSPAIRGVSLPKSFSELPRPSKLFEIRKTAEELGQTFSDWQEAVVGPR